MNEYTIHESYGFLSPDISGIQRRKQRLKPEPPTFLKTKKEESFQRFLDIQTPKLRR